MTFKIIDDNDDDDVDRELLKLATHPRSTFSY